MVEIPEDLTSLQALNQINLSSNQISVIPDSVFNKSALLHLNLSNNQIELMGAAGPPSAPPPHNPRATPYWRHRFPSPPRSESGTGMQADPLTCNMCGGAAEARERLLAMSVYDPETLSKEESAELAMLEKVVDEEPVLELNSIQNLLLRSLARTVRLRLMCHAAWRASRTVGFSGCETRVACSRVSVLVFVPCAQCCAVTRDRGSAG